MQLRSGGSLATTLLIVLATLLTSVDTQGQCVSPPAGLVNWWQAENDYVDFITTNAATPHNAVSFAPGIVGSAFAFDGVNSYIEVPDDPALRLTNEISVEFWVKRQRLDYYDFIIEKGGDWTRGENNFTVALHIAPYQHCLTFLFAGGARGGGSVSDLNWHHCAVVARNGDLDPVFYIDGIRQTITYRDGSAFIHLFPSRSPTHIGAQVDPISGWNYFGKALIDELSVYDRRLSEAEVQSIFKSGSAGKCRTFSGPVIASQPLSQSVLAGDPVVFSVLASGTQPLSFQWNFNGNALPGATTKSFEIASAQATDAGTYSVTVTNAYGSVTSSNAVLTIIASPDCVPPPPGIKAWWAFEDQSTDLIASLHGAQLGGVTFSNGIVHKAVAFDGVDGVIEVPDNPMLRMTNEVSVEFWVKRQRLDYFDFIVEKGGDWTRPDNNYTVALHIAPYNHCLTFLFAGGWRGAGSIGDLEWHHCAVVARHGQTDPVFFIDGVQQPVTHRAGAALINLAHSERPLHIGAQVDPVSGWNYFSKAIIDELSIYDRSLTASEIRAIHQARDRGKCVTPTPPVILSQPAGQTVFAGTNVALSVVAVGSPPLAYQWNFNGAPISGATSSTLSFAAVALENAGTYNVLVTNQHGSVLSSNAVLVVNELPPFIAVQPKSQSVDLGKQAVFSVVAYGSPVLNYQWFYNDSPISDATNTSLVLPNVQPVNEGAYHVVVTNLLGSALSAKAILTVTYPPTVVDIANGTVGGGRTVTLPVRIAANGKENALAFSLSFDPTLLKFSGFDPGTATMNAAILLNETQAASGKIGAAIGLAAGAEFTAGTQEVALVTFKAAMPTQNRTAWVRFSDTPLARQVSDAAGRSLEAVYANGLVTILATQFEGDTSPRPSGDRVVNLNDWVMAGRFAARLEYPTNEAEFQRADTAPRDGSGDGLISVTDWVQTGRYAARLDPLAPADGPVKETSGGFGPSLLWDSSPRKLYGNRKAALVGEQVVISVYFDTLGDENAAGFSLSFDAERVEFRGAAAGPGAMGSQFTINSLAAGTGRLGLLVGQATGKIFPAGTHEIARLTFQVKSAEPGLVPIQFANLPIKRQVADANAGVLLAGYAQGGIEIVTIPSLAIRQDGNNAVLSWPESGGLFHLEQASQLSGPWDLVPADAIVLVDQRYSAGIPAIEGSRYFRLKK